MIFISILILGKKFENCRKLFTFVFYFQTMQKIILILVTIILTSCQKAPSNSTNIVEQPLETIRFETENEALAELEKSMKSYMETSTPPPYSSADIEQCLEIIQNYLALMELSKSKAEGMKVVENTIIQLNSLNEKCQSQLIETYQRDIIANIIINASHKKGYNSIEEDITLQWRHW